MNITINQVQHCWKKTNFEEQTSKIELKIGDFKDVKHLSKVVFLIYYNQYILKNDTYTHLQKIKDFNMLKRYVDALDLPIDRKSLKPFKNNTIVLEAIFLKLMCLPDEIVLNNELLAWIEEIILPGLFSNEIRTNMIEYLEWAYEQIGQPKTYNDIMNTLAHFIYLKYKDSGIGSVSYNNQILFICSRYDEWYAELFLEDDRIELYHKNKKYDIDKYHKQKLFKYPYSSIENVLSYIENHDRYVLNDKYNYDKLFELLKPYKKKSV